MKQWYMHYILSFVCSAFILITACNTPKTTTSTTVDTTVGTLIKDSIEFYETDFEVRQKNYRELLMGTWTIDTMHRQSQLPGEYLTNVYITFGDSTFTGNAGCNRIFGNYILKGTSIKFENIGSTKMACSRLEQETAFLELLQSTVSAYTVTKSTLWLRDGASNIVFHASRK